MVTRLTSYTKQRYVRNSTDDPGDIVFRNGDTVFLMDTQQEIIYSEDDNQWYQVPAAGGGGGGVPISNAQYLEFTPATTATSSNPLSINLTPVTSGNKYWLVCWIKDLPAPGDVPIAVYCGYQSFRSQKDGTIMRIDGTYGTDQNQFAFVPSTGVFTVGGQYGSFPAGQPYCVLLVEVS